MMRRLTIATVALLALPLAGCSGGSHHDASKATGTRASSTPAASSTASPSSNWTGPSGTNTIGPPAAGVTYRDGGDDPDPTNTSSAVSAPAGTTTLTQVPNPSSVDRSNPDAVASAFLATTNILNAGKDDQGSGYAKAAYLATDLELSQIQSDGDTNLNVDPEAWSAAVKGKSTSKVYAKSVALDGAAADTSTSANRCYMVNRVWTPTVHGTAITEAQFRDCYVLSKANGKWSVSSENFMPPGD